MPLALVVLAFGWTAASAAYRATLPAAVILLATLGVAVLVASTPFSAHASEDRWHAIRLTTLLTVAVCVLLAMNPKVTDGFQLPKFTVLLLGALVLGSLVAADALTGGRTDLRLRSKWPVLALVAWAVVATAFSTSPRISLLGSYGSYDGLATLVALAAVYLVAAATVRLRDLHRVALTLCATGAVITLYGLVQVHDRILQTGSAWDWNAWDRVVLSANIFGFLGNPNHLGGFIAWSLPLVAALVVVSKRLWARIALAGFAVVLLFELQKTGARGAFLGAVAGLGVFGVAAAPASVWKRGAVLKAAAGAGAAIVLAGVVLVAAPRVAGPGGLLSSLPVVQRIEFAKSSLHMALDRPLVGQGPDTFNTQFSRYITKRAYHLLGVRERPDSPHNVLMSFLYGLGFPGLIAFLIALGTAAFQAERAWRTLRARDGAVSRTQTTLFAGVLGGGGAMLVVLLFDVQRVVLSLQLWLSLGIIAAVATEVLSPPAERKPVPRKSPSRGVVAAGLAVLVVVAGLGAWLATRPLRANADFQAANNIAAAQLQANPQDLPSADKRAALESGFSRADASVGQNPWEAGYSYLAGTFARAIAEVELVFKDPASPEIPQAATRWFRTARQQLARSVALEPQAARFDQGYIQTLDAIAAHGGSNRATEREALRVRRLAARYNPARADIALDLAKALEKRGSLDEATRELRSALEWNPASPDLLRLAAQIGARRGDAVAARRYWTRLLRAVPSDAETKAALGAP